ncbi:hypothetical protein V6N13_113815 [Hibiscus sabdariffa]|uniref:Uncharacterized protein n=1 Tax=Hibiscus sabdariffa TaxID=183260 RepID=A0ABR2U0G7_9ROSI
MVTCIRGIDDSDHPRVMMWHPSVDQRVLEAADLFTPLIYDLALEFHHFLPTTALSGDVDALYRLIYNDTNVFNRIDEMEFVDTPLHVSDASGNTGFAMEMMSLKPSFTRKLNRDGFSLIHLALLKDHAVQSINSSIICLIDK